MYLLLFVVYFVGQLRGAHAVIDARMYTRLACPSVKHRWLAASQYLSSTTWTDGVQSGAQDALLLNTDTDSPAISKPYYDASSQSVVFSPRSQASTTGPYVNLQSVHFGTGAFTFVILAKYNASGSGSDNWPRIFDFSTTGTPSGTYFILTEARARAAGARCATRADARTPVTPSCARNSMATRTWCTPLWALQGRRTRCARTTPPSPAP